MDIKTRDIGLVECSLTWQHMAFQLRGSADSFFIIQKFNFLFSKSEFLRIWQNTITPLNVFKKAADFVSYHKVCCFSFF